MITRCATYIEHYCCYIHLSTVFYYFKVLDGNSETKPTAVQIRERQTVEESAYVGSSRSNTFHDCNQLYFSPLDPENDYKLWKFIKETSV